MNLVEEQQIVLGQIHAYLAERRPAKPYFMFQGLPGVGKSFLLSAVADLYPGALMCAFTGKAASVLSRRTKREATTIHSAIYQFTGLDRYQRPQFMSKLDDGEWTNNIALVDEGSMVSEELGRDLLATGCKVIVSRGQGQLPPVNGVEFFREPDAELRDVHRQAWDSAIIRQVHRIYQTGSYDVNGDGPDFQVKRNISADEIMTADVILCFRNTTRSKLNALVRAHRGLRKDLAAEGEPVMCLKNNHALGLLNGAVYTLLERHFPGDGVIHVRNERGQIVMVRKAWIEDFEQAQIGEPRALNPFAFGYAATVHKSQGSEWNRVILVDEYTRAEHRKEWIFTGISRAAKQVIVQRSW